MSVLKKFVSRFTGNGISQSMLEYNVKFSHYLMGVGCGTKVETSGELALVRLVNECRSATCRIIDAGANIGQFSNLITSRCPNTALEIHCFEPGQDAFEQLQARFSNDTRLQLNNVALGAEPGAATLYSDTPASGLSSLTRRDLSHHGRHMELSESVQVQTLDDYCAERGIDHIDLLKIDVEGHELDVLRGAQRMLDEQRVDAVSFEFGGCHVDTRVFVRELYYFFRQREMDVYRITPRGYLRHLPKYHEILEQFLTTNYLARSSRAA
jgi:FkbM family methyltransferase